MKGFDSRVKRLTCSSSFKNGIKICIIRWVSYSVWWYPNCPITRESETEGLRVEASLGFIVSPCLKNKGKSTMEMSTLVECVLRTWVQIFGTHVKSQGEWCTLQSQFQGDRWLPRNATPGWLLAAVHVHIQIHVPVYPLTLYTCRKKRGRKLNFVIFNQSGFTVVVVFVKMWVVKLA